VHIPIFVNGDIDSPQKAKFVLEQTGADGVMIGRSAQGNPWIFREVDYFLRTGNFLPPPSIAEVRDIMRAHLRNLYAHYGEWAGVRVARKHIAWYAKGKPYADAFRATVMQAESARAQQDAVEAYLDLLASPETAKTAA
jgi:tRNA-dihydrouridine synthase B